MAELVDALDSGSSRGNSVDVRVILAANFHMFHLPEKTSCAVITNGKYEDHTLIASIIQNYEGIIAVDGGLLHCKIMGIYPDLIIGDMDSIDPQLLSYYSDVPIIKLSTEKDVSDTEAAIEMIDERSIQRIGLFGALGLRADHSLSNLYLLHRFSRKNIVIEKEEESIFLLEKQQTVQCNPGQNISLIPLGCPAKKVTTQGLKWELNDATLDKNFFSLSNICLTGSFHISIGEGSLLVCLSRCQFTV